MRKSRIVLTLIAALLLFGSLISLPKQAFAEHSHFKDSSVKLYLKTFYHVDVGYYVQKLKDIFFSEKFKKEHPQVELLEKFINKTGYFAITDYEFEKKIVRGKIYMRETIRLSDEYPESTLYQIAQLRDRKFRIGSLFTDQDYLVLVAINNYDDLAKILLEEVSETLRDEKNVPPQFMQILNLLRMFELKEEFAGALGKELDLVLFELPPFKEMASGNMDKIFAAILIPVNDFTSSEALLRNYGGILGFSLDKPSFSSVDWRFWEILNTNFYAGLSGEWFVLTNKPSEFTKLVLENRKKFHKDLPDGNSFIRINADRLFREVIKPIAMQLKRENPKLAEKEIAYFFDIDESTQFGNIDIHTSYRGNRMTTTTTLNDDVVNALFYIISIALESSVLEQMQSDHKARRERMMKRMKKMHERKAKKFDSRVPF